VSGGAPALLRYPRVSRVRPLGAVVVVGLAGVCVFLWQFAALVNERAERAYAESLAMILFIVERAGDAGLKAAVASVRLGRPERGLWEVLYPGTDHRAVLDALARKLFGVPVGGELDAMLRGAVCCHGLRAVGELRCRGVPPRPDRMRWTDQSSSPRDACDATW
jgi:hypothetical protein